MNGKNQMSSNQGLKKTRSRLNSSQILHRLAGFTLIELMIVISIIGVLASTAVPYLARARETTMRQQCWSNCGLLFRTTEVFLTENGGVDRPGDPGQPEIISLLSKGKIPVCPRSGNKYAYVETSNDPNDDDASLVKCVGPSGHGWPDYENMDNNPNK